MNKSVDRAIGFTLNLSNAAKRSPPTFFLGENVLVHYCLENTPLTAFQISWGGDSRGASRSVRFKTTLTMVMPRSAHVSRKSKSAHDPGLPNDADPVRFTVRDVERAVGRQDAVRP
jgi:hypothetical protein